MPLQSRQVAKSAHPQHPHPEPALLCYPCEVQGLLSRVLELLRGKKDLFLFCGSPACHRRFLGRKVSLSILATTQEASQLTQAHVFIEGLLATLAMCGTCSPEYCSCLWLTDVFHHGSTAQDPIVLQFCLNVISFFFPVLHHPLSGALGLRVSGVISGMASGVHYLDFY